MRRFVLGLVLLFALGDSCAPSPGVVGVQDYGQVTGRVLDAMTNRPLPNALVSVGSLYTASADARGAFVLGKVPAGDQTVTARAPGYSYGTGDVTVLKDRIVSVGIRPAGPGHPPRRASHPPASGDAEPATICDRAATEAPAPGIAPTPGGAPVVSTPTPGPAPTATAPANPQPPNRPPPARTKAAPLTKTQRGEVEVVLDRPKDVVGNFARFAHPHDRSPLGVERELLQAPVDATVVDFLFFVFGGFVRAAR